MLRASQIVAYIKLRMSQCRPLDCGKLFPCLAGMSAEERGEGRFGF